MSAVPATQESPLAIPHQTLASLFLRFLRFGALAWGGPVAQIAMVRQSLVDEERWITSEHFNRALALYQVLPGPEAHELCVYFGMLARGRVGGMLAGLGFMLPGFVLMFALSWAYAEFGLDLHGVYAPLFAAIQAAVVALIVRAVHRLGSHILLDGWLWAIAILACAGQLLGVHFGILLLIGGISYVLVSRSVTVAATLLVLCAASLGAWALIATQAQNPAVDALVSAANGTPASLATLFWSGLKAGLLTFGGAYTAIPLLQRDAVREGGWMSDSQFMDGIGLSGLLPAPLIIFATFVGYMGGGPWGAIVVTLAVFLPAFAFTLLAHDRLEALISLPRIRSFLDGLTAAVVGLIAATAVSLIRAGITDAVSVVIFFLAVVALFLWKSRSIIPCVIAGSALVGLIVTAVR
jgi:chromate transporter